MFVKTKTVSRSNVTRKTNSVTSKMPGGDHLKTVWGGGNLGRPTWARARPPSSFPCVRRPYHTGFPGARPGPTSEENGYRGPHREDLRGLCLPRFLPL